MPSLPILRKSPLLLRKSVTSPLLLCIHPRSLCLPRTDLKMAFAKQSIRQMSSVDGPTPYPNDASIPPESTEAPTEVAGKESTAVDPGVAQAEEIARVKNRRLRMNTTAKDPETVELPEELDIFWLPGAADLGRDSPPSSNLPPPEIYEEAFNNLLITLHPQIQYRATYPQGADSPVEPTLGLYCPIEGGDYIIDETVRELAKQIGAEVLVLDSVQLAAGEWGEFGKAANSLRLPVNPLHFSSPNHSSSAAKNEATEAELEEESDSPGFPSPHMMTLTLLAPPQGRTVMTSSPRRSASRSKIKVFFDTVINSMPKQTPGTSPDSSSNPPRIIYIRDFSTLASTSSTWYPPLLSAVRDRRRGATSRPSSAISNRTTIIFGMTPPLVPSTADGVGPNSSLVNFLMNRTSSTSMVPQEPKPERYDWTESDAAEKARERRLQDRLRKWEKHEPSLLDDFPKLAASVEEDTGDLQKPEIIMVGPNNRGGVPGFPSMFGSSPSPPPRGIDPDTRTTFFRTSVLVPAKRSHSRERASRMARRREVNELSMRMGVGSVGGSVEPSPASKYFEQARAVETEITSTPPDKAAPSEHNLTGVQKMWNDWGNRIEVWSNVKKIADSAIGGVLSSSGHGKSLDATVVPWFSVQSAWASQKSLRDQRKNWLKDIGSLNIKDVNDESEVPEAETTNDEIVDRVRSEQDLDTYEQRLLGCIVDSASMPTSFSQVHLPPHVIDSVRTIVSLPLLHPDAFQQGILKQHGMTGCLLFGPPGTGKTLVVRALAKEAGCRMLVITPSDIMDMYVGEAEKLVRAVFSLARRLSPCVIFLDEIDALFGARMAARESGGAAAAHRGVITEFMQEMDGLKSSHEDGVIIIGATNRPFDLDDAVLRRLPRRLLIDLPGEMEREGILKILLRDEVLAPDVTTHLLAKQTENFSGSDLKHLCVSAALDAVKERVHVPWNPLPLEQQTGIPTSPPKQEQQSLASSHVVQPASTSDQNLEHDVSAATATSKTPHAEIRKAHTRVLHLRNFTKALKEITPSSSESLGSLGDLRKWNEEFGEGRRDRRRRQVWGKGRFGFVDEKAPSKEGNEGKVAAKSSSSHSSSVDSP